MKDYLLKLGLTNIIIGVCYSFYAQDPSLEWSVSSGSYFSKSIVVDDNENSVFAGYFIGTTDADPGGGTYQLTSNGGHDIFIEKIDENGAFVWAKSIGGANNEQAHAVALDQQGNVFVTGYFEGVVDFDPGTGVQNITSAGQEDVFVLKLDANGNFLWVKTFGGISEDKGVSIAVDQLGNVYTVGYFMGVVDMDPGTGIDNHNGSWSFDEVFIQKLDGNGNFVWAKSVGGNGDDRANGVEVDGLGNVLVTGTFKTTADFDPGIGVHVENSVGNKDIYILKLKPNGDFDWVQVFGSNQREEGLALTIDTDNNIHAVGSFSSTIDFDPGSGTNNQTSNGDMDGYYLKLNMFGDFMLVRTFGGGQPELITSIDLDEFENIYMCGMYSATTDFDPGTGVNNLTSNGVGDNFILKLDANANFSWAGSFGTYAADHCNDIAVDIFENIYVTGGFQLTLDMDPDTGVYELITTGGYNTYVSKFSQCMITPGTDIISACDSIVWIDGITYTTDNNTASYLIEEGAENGCDSLVYLELTINKTPVPDIDFNLELSCQGALVKTENNTSADSYQWEIDNGISSSESSISFVLPYGGEYQINLEASNNGCTSKLDTIIEVDSFLSLLEKPANVFTPNGDGQNDILRFGIPKELKDCTSLYTIDGEERCFVVKQTKCGGMEKLMEKLRRREVIFTCSILMNNQ